MNIPRGIHAMVHRLKSNSLDNSLGYLKIRTIEKVAYIQFLEDSYGTAGSFKTGGATRIHSDPSGKEVEV